MNRIHWLWRVFRPVSVFQDFGLAGLLLMLLAVNSAANPQEVNVADTIGPVVASVNVKKRDDFRIADTVTVVFSEGVVINTSSLVFPFDIRDKDGAIVTSAQPRVRQINKINDYTYSFVFDSTVTYLNIQPGYTLGIKDGAGVTDLSGNPSSPVHISVVVERIHISQGITAKANAIAVGEATYSGVVNTPVFLVFPPIPEGGDVPPWHTNYATVDPSLERYLADRQLDPSDPVRTQVLTKSNLLGGPVITVQFKRLGGGVEFDLNFFDHLGKSINSAKGTVTQATLESSPLMLAVLNDIKKDNPTNKYAIGLQWYPFDFEGNQVGSGVYIAKGTIRILGYTVNGTQIPQDVKEVFVKMGYVRK